MMINFSDCLTFGSIMGITHGAMDMGMARGTMITKGITRGVVVATAVTVVSYATNTLFGDCGFYACALGSILATLVKIGDDFAVQQRTRRFVESISDEKLVKIIDQINGSQRTKTQHFSSR